METLLCVLLCVLVLVVVAMGTVFVVGGIDDHKLYKQRIKEMEEKYETK